jgi:hypothetical protein
MNKKQDFTGMAVGVYAVPDPPVVTLYAVMEPAMTIGPTWLYVPQTITPEMIRAIIREELERFDRRDRKKRRRK